MVLHGSSALVLPLKVGQHMTVSVVEQSMNPVVKWRARVLKELWFDAEISVSDWTIRSATDMVVASKLLVLLQEAGNLNHRLFTDGCDFNIHTDTGFHNDWGLGSSSAVVANIAQWAKINPFELLFRTFGGSGADIAAAISPGPVHYRLLNHNPVYCSVAFQPAFLKNLWLVYLGNKQNTTKSVAAFKLNGNVSQKQIDTVDILTMNLIRANSLDYFMNLVHEHELILSEILGIPRIKESLFSDFPGEMKSLGAWGGDFALAVSKSSHNEVREYFSNKGIHPVYSYSKLVMQ